ncbi:copper resistance protein CopC, partial [Micromonospora zhanjiangensis]
MPASFRSFRPSLVRLAGAALAALLVVPLVAGPAEAHNALRSADPARDATLTAPPATVTLEFMESLDPAFTTVRITDGDRRPVPTGAPVVTGGKATIGLNRALTNGTYTVAYRVVSKDGHPVQGSYPFTVAAPGAAAAPRTTGAAPTTAAEA